MADRVYDIILDLKRQFEEEHPDISPKKLVLSNAAFWTFVHEVKTVLTREEGECLGPGLTFAGMCMRILSEDRPVGILVRVVSGNFSMSSQQPNGVRAA